MKLDRTGRVVKQLTADDIVKFSSQTETTIVQKMLICDLVINLISEIERVRKLNDFGHLVNWVIIMQRELCSSSDDEEVVNVPQFLPSEGSTRVTSNSDSVVEIVFSNLTKYAKRPLFCEA